MSTSISKIPEIDVDIHFIKKSKKITKRMSRSISEKCETDVDIRFIKKQKN